MSKSCALLVGVLLLLALHTGSWCIAATYALVVGIGTYESQGEHLHELFYTDEDARTLALVLQEEWGSTNVKTLTNEKATRINIETWFADLSSTISSNDVVILYFAGHGGRVDDTNGDEAFDEALYPYDVKRLPNPQQSGPYFHPHSAITDDTLGNWIVEYLGDCTVIAFLDACSSGGMIRSDSQSFQDRGTAGFTGRGLLTTPGRDGRTLVLASCEANEQSIETYLLGHGVFSHFLIEGLKGDADVDPVDGEVSFEELSDYVRAEVPEWIRINLPNEGISQHPVAECSSSEDCGERQVIVSRGASLSNIELAYVSDLNGNSNIWLSPLEMTLQKNITGNLDPRRQYSYPRWSPDGTRLAYIEWEREDETDYTFLKVYDVATETLQTLYTSSNSVFGSTGGHILYVLWLDDDNIAMSIRLCDRGAGLYRVTIGSNHIDPFLVLPSSELRSADVSPDEEMLLFVKTEAYWGYTGEICVADLATLAVEQITATSNRTSDVDNNRGCRFVDDEHILILRGNDERIWKLWSSNVDGSELISISDGFPENLHFGDWQFGVGDDGTVVIAGTMLSTQHLSQTGGKIAGFDAYDLYLTDVYGGSIVNLTNTPGVSERYPDLRPIN